MTAITIALGVAQAALTIPRSLPDPFAKAQWWKWSKIAMGAPGSGSNCSPEGCIFDRGYGCEELPGFLSGQCGFLEAQAESLCGGWPLCAGVVCDPSYEGYCLARNEMTRETSATHTGYVKEQPANYDWERLEEGAPGTGSACKLNSAGSRVCIYDDRFCVKRKGFEDECSIEFNKVEDLCGRWPLCAGVVCPSGGASPVFCQARGEISATQRSNKYYGFKKVAAPGPPSPPPPPPGPPPPPPPPPSQEGCKLDASGCSWMGPPCETVERKLPAETFVPVNPAEVTFPGLDDINNDVRVVGGWMAGSSVGSGNITRAKIKCGFIYTDTTAVSNMLVAIEDGPHNGPKITKIVEIGLTQTASPIVALQAVALRAGHSTDLGGCRSAFFLKQLWERAITAPVATCETCEGYGVAGLALAEVEHTGPGESTFYDLADAALPSGLEYTAIGEDTKQTYFYNFCRGVLDHGSESNSPGFRCKKGRDAVCEISQDTVDKGLAYPLGSTHSAKLQVVPGGQGAIEIAYENGASLENRRNAEVTMICDPYANEPVFFPVKEFPSNGPKYQLGIRTRAGCKRNTMGDILPSEFAAFNATLAREI